MKAVFLASFENTDRPLSACAKRVSAAFGMRIVVMHVTPNVPMVRRLR
ncbi:MAG TPA: hypothetical protein VFK82_04265 [Burkholderiaceae bacterium]|nr:hypothetical protein [Burkholderiaceae bacterium]